MLDLLISLHYNLGFVIFTGLWITTSSFIEQPDVDFKHQIISVIDTVVENGGRSQPSYLAWSTYPQFNVIHQANIRIPTVKV